MSLISNAQTTFSIIPSASIPAPPFDLAYGDHRDLVGIRSNADQKLSIAERMYAIRLHHQLVPSSLGGSTAYNEPKPVQAPAVLYNTNAQAQSVPREITSTTIRKPSYSSIGNKFGLIGDANINKFYDLLVEVVRFYPGDFDVCELYVTDYTSHKFLYDYPAPEEEHELGRDGDTYGYMDYHKQQKRRWPGPYGQMALRVEVHQPHASFVKEKVKEGDWVILRNLRVKLSNANKMEGNMWPDQRYPSKVLIELPQKGKFEETTALLERKEKYWKGKKRVLSDDEDDDQPKVNAKKQRKKQKEKEKKRAKAAAAAGIDIEKYGVSDVEVAVSKYVRCANLDIGLSTLTQIMDTPRVWKTPAGEEVGLPFTVQKRRAKVRVVDFYPDSLVDLAKFGPASQSSEEIGSDIEMGGTADELTPGTGWEWNFFLLVEDAKPPLRLPEGEEPPRLWLHVANRDAQYLLKMDATDLKADGAALGQLKEKLFLLWGNLEELKSGTAEIAEPSTDDNQDVQKMMLPSNQPFECCIREFGHEVSEEDEGDETPMGHIRLYEMFETTIL